MDLYVRSEDFAPIFRKIHDHYQMGSDRLFAWKGSTLSPGSMQFGMGWEDQALFNHHHPMDADNYNVFSVRTLYEALLQYAKNEVPDKYIVEQTMAPGKVKINIGRMAEQIEHRLEVEEPFGIEAYRSNIENLQYRAKMVGFKSDLTPYLERKVQGNTDPFKYVEYQQFAGNTVLYKLHFERDSQNRRYTFPRYDATLLQKMPVDHAVIYGVHTKELEAKMKHMDWYYSINESVAGVIKGYQEWEVIERSLQLLCNDTKGAIIAAQLWNNNVPLNTVQKPVFIKQAEEESKLYTTLTFASVIPAYLAYKDLQKKQELNAVSNQQNAHDQIRTGTVEPTVSWYKEMGLKYYEAFRDSTHRHFNEGTSLLFKENKPGELLDFFRKQSEAGNDYVVYDPLHPITTKELHCYELFVDAQMHCYENSKDLNQYFFTSIEQMQVELQYSNDINLLEGYVQYLEPKMKYADWTHDYSDDREVSMRGAIEISKIENELRKFCQLPGGIEKANALWDAYVPENTYGKPTFMLPVSNNETKLASINETAVLTEQIRDERLMIGGGASTTSIDFAFLEIIPGEIKNHLREMQSQGHKWVAYQEEEIPMTKESMRCFKETFDVMEYCHENTTDLDRYTYVSIVEMNEAVTKWEGLSEKDIDLMVLETRMASADWQYSKSASREQVEKGIADMEAIEKGLILLCKMPGGFDKANRLWDQYASGSPVSKPFYLQGNLVDPSVLKQETDSQNKQALQPITPSSDTSEKKGVAQKPEMPAKQRKHRHRRDM